MVSRWLAAFLGSRWEQKRLSLLPGEATGGTLRTPALRDAGRATAAFLAFLEWVALRKIGCTSPWEEGLNGHRRPRVPTPLLCDPEQLSTALPTSVSSL